MTNYSDQEILKCLRNRENYVVRFIYDRYFPMIKLMIYQKGGTIEDAKDIFQNALIIMIEKIDKKDFVLTCKFKTFLYSVSVNLWLTVLTERKNAEKYLATKLVDFDDEDFTEIYDNVLFKNIINEIYESLDPVCKNILKRYWEEENPKEIAKELGYTYGYVRKKKCQCHANLIDMVKKHPTYISIKRSDELTANYIYE